MKQHPILRIAFWVGIATLILAISTPLMAQTSKGTIAGTVTDRSGAVLSGATVVATSVDSGETRTVTTSSTGSYRIEALNLGNYILKISQAGFETKTITNVVVRGSVIVQADAQLAVGSTETTVTVEAQTNAIQTESGQLSHAIGSTEITSIPIGNLNPISLVLTEPGVVDVSGGGGRNFSNGTGFSVNGNRSRSNNFLIDGQDNNDNSIAGQAFQPANLNTVQEVTVLTNSYSAEFGRGGASVTNVIYKSGTNQFHGGLWELYEGSGLNAVNAYDGTYGQTSREKPRYNIHTYGFYLGGPVIKNKLFFSASSQWQRFYGKATPNVIAVPTANGVAALQAYGSANALLLLKYYNGLVAPTASNTYYTGINSTGTPIEFGFMQRTPPPQQNPDTQWNFKVDWLATSKDSVSVRYVHDRSSLTPDFFNFPTSLPGLDPQQGGPSENFGMTWTRTFNPRAINEFRASYGYFDFAFAPTATALANPLYKNPTMGISGISRMPGLGVNAALPQGRGHATYQVQDAFSITNGNHTWKMGFDIARLLIKDSIPFNSRGTISFTSGGGYTGLGNFLDNYTGSGGSLIARTFGDPVVRPKVMQQAFYIQDTWKLRSNLTIDYGIRYEFQNNPENQIPYPAVDLSKVPFDTFPRPVKVKEDGNNWGPRFGMAYTPKFWEGLFGQDKTVFRLGYGMFYDAFFTNILDNTAAGSPNAVVGTNGSVTGRGTAGALGYAVSPVLNPLSAVTSVDSNLRNPFTHQWNVNIERELPWDLLVTAAYVGTRGSHLFINQQFNPNTGYSAGYGSPYLPRVNPAQGSIGVRTNSGDSIYHGFNVKVERRFTKGLMLRSAYTFGKAIDNGSEVFTITGGSSYPQVNGPAGLKLERGLSAYDVRHRWVLAYVYNVPGIPKYSNGFVNALGFLTRDWSWSGTTTLQSGVPDTVYFYGLDTDGDGNAYNNRPYMGNPAAPIASVGIDGLYLGETPGQLYNYDTGVPVTTNDVRWIVKPGAGNVGRNTYIGPGSIRFDMAFNRSFKMPKMENHEFQVRGEFFNIFNHPNNNGWVDTSAIDGSSLGGFMDTVGARTGGRTIKVQLKYVF